MCIAIYKPADKKLSKETLEICWDANPDGAGFMYVHNGSLRIKKGFMSFDRFFASFNNLQHKSAVLHFRIKTHGKVDEHNTHPFYVDKTLGFIHNGIISKVSTTSNKEMSDTWHFNESILKPLFKLNEKFIDNEAIQELIDSYIGASKLVFMDKNENVWIINEGLGNWDEGIWYSNSSYKPFTKTIYSGNPTYPATTYSPPKKEKPHYKYADMRNLTINSIVELRDPYLKMKQGALGVVETFYQDHTCGVLFFDEHSRIGEYVRVPIYLLDIADEDVIVSQQGYC